MRRIFRMSKRSLFPQLTVSRFLSHMATRRGVVKLRGGSAALGRVA